MYRSVFKRLLDIVVSLLLIVLLSPVLIVIALLLRLEQKQIFFMQERPGRFEKPFRIVKFKSMNDARDSNGNLLPDFERLTKVGRFTRNHSLDELPQLFNVLAGSMSLVGPRPLLFKYIPLYSPDQRRRHDVRPGITGWAQVNGRNQISWTEKFKLDIEYVDNVSLLFDVRILWLTFAKVVRKEGINQSAERPMQPFNGKN